MALSVPKLELPKIALSQKQILGVVAGVIIVCAVGWFGWRYFEDAAPPAKPQPVAAAKQPGPAKAVAPVAAGPARDKLIEDVLAASGLKQQLDQLPQQLGAGIRQSGKRRAPRAADKAIENAVAEAFAAQDFRSRVSADLKKNFDEQRLQALLKDFSTPAAKRMVGLGQAAPSAEELARFARSQAATPPSPQRAGLLKRIDTATRAGDLAVDVAFASMKVVAAGIAGERAAKTAAIDQAIEKNRAAATQQIRNAALLSLAFASKDASDAELEAYAKFYETENSKWLTGIVYASMLEQAKSAATQAAERIGALAGAAPAAKPARSKAGMDARACLDQEGNPAIIKCAEQYR